MRSHRARHQKCALQIYVHRRVPQIFTGLYKGHALGDTCDVHQDVHSTVASYNFCNHSFYLSLPANIANCGLYRRSCVRHLAGQHIHLGAVDVRDDDMGALPSQPNGDRPADALRPTHDDRDLAFETFRRNLTELSHGLLLRSFHFGSGRRPTRCVDEVKDLTPAFLPERVRKGCLPLDKDLSRKSGNRTSWAVFNCLATALSATRSVGAESRDVHVPARQSAFQCIIPGNPFLIGEPWILCNLQTSGFQFVVSASCASTCSSRRKAPRMARWFAQSAAKISPLNWNIPQI